MSTYQSESGAPPRDDTDPTIDLRHGAGAETDDSLSALLTDLTHDVNALLRTQLQLAVVEVREEAQRAARGGGLIAGGGLTAYLGLTALMLSAGFGLAEWLDLWAAFLIVGAVIGAIAAAITWSGREALRHTDPVPRQTIETLQEDKRWLQQQMS